jgi:hypothetical protein
MNARSQYSLARGRSAGISPARRCTFRHLAATAACPKVEKSDTWSRPSALIMPGSRVRVPPFPPLNQCGSDSPPESPLISAPTEMRGFRSRRSGERQQPARPLADPPSHVVMRRLCTVSASVCQRTDQPQGIASTSYGVQRARKVASERRVAPGRRPCITIQLRSSRGGSPKSWNGCGTSVTESSIGDSLAGTRESL